MTALGFTASAAHTMLEIAQREPDLLQETALWWILNHMHLRWADTDLAAKVKAAGIYDPDKVTVVSSIVPPPDPAQALSLPEVLAHSDDATRGSDKIAACRLCHVAGDSGTDYAPNLNGWVSRQGVEQAIYAIIDPNRDIAHGYDGRDVELHDGTHIHGLMLAQGDPTVVKSMGGLTQMIPADRVKGVHWYGRSLMLSADQLGLSAQDVADIVSYLKEH
ncbi:MAG: hypothetical protein J6386_05235 [Candidatus Synoicihabitans palmerolidicus]|nr:hypothetical protein [Candidatus Synoicihabitans palmerolidicus]